MLTLRPSRSCMGPISLSLFLLCASTVFAQDAKALRVGIDADNEPWSFVPSRLRLYFSGPRQEGVPRPATREELGAIGGIDVEVARALARRMGATVEFVTDEWPNLEDGLLKHRFDVIVNSWTPGRGTRRKIQASDPYYFWGLQVAVRSDNAVIRSLRDLVGVKVAHTEDPAVEEVLQGLHAVSSGPYAEERDLFRDLETGVVPVVIADSVYVRWRVANSRSFRTVGGPLNRLGYHVAVRVEDAELFHKVQEAVRAFVASPQLDEIRRHWEALDASPVPKE